MLYGASKIDYLPDDNKKYMQMELNITITAFEVEIKPVIRADEIKAFVTWYFVSNLGKIKLTGCTIKLKEFGENKVKVLTVDVPAIKFRFGKYFKAFYLPDLETFKRICRFTLDEYLKMSGELPADITIDSPSEEVNPDDIPF